MSSPRRYAPARDHNEKPIVDRLLVDGWRVYRLLKPVDLLALCPWCAGAELLEVKNAEGRDRPTPGQEDLEEWNREAFYVIYDPGEVLHFVDRHRERTGCSRRGVSLELRPDRSVKAPIFKTLRKSFEGKNIR